MGGPSVGFRWGRNDADGPKDPKEDARFSPDGRLPDGFSPDWKDMGAQHLRDIFHRMGFDDRGIVALSGMLSGMDDAFVDNTVPSFPEFLRFRT